MSARRAGRAGFVAPVLVALVLTGCDVVGLNASPRTDSREFDLPGMHLTIESDSNLRLEEGAGRTLTVSRTLAGMATRDGNASWELAGSTLRLHAECAGPATGCTNSYTVRVPPGTNVTAVAGDARVGARSLTGNLEVRTAEGAVRVAEPHGSLRLRSESGEIEVTGARSEQVSAGNLHSNLTLTFAEPPRQVDARSESGSVTVRLPAGDTGYRVVADAPREIKKRVEVAEDPDATNSVTAGSGTGMVRVLTDSS